MAFRKASGDRAGRRALPGHALRREVSDTLDKAIAEAKDHGLGLPNQIDFLKQFDAALTAGRIEGYSR